MFLSNFAAWLTGRVKEERHKQEQLEDLTQTFILEPIYTPGGLLDGGDDSEGLDLDPIDDISDGLDSDIDGETDSGFAGDGQGDEMEDGDESVSDDDLDEENGFDEPVDVDDEDVNEEDIGDEIPFADDEPEADDETSDESESDDEISGELDETDEVDSDNESSDDIENSDSDDESSDDVENSDSDDESSDDVENSDSDDDEIADSDDESSDDVENSDDSDDNVENSDSDDDVENSDSDDDVENSDSDDDEIADSDDESSDDELDEDESEDDEIPLAFELPSFNSGVFTVGDSGQVGVDFLFDGGSYKGEVAFFSLAGLEEMEFESVEDFIAEAVNRATSNSEQGHIVISDSGGEAARFTGSLMGERDHNSGVYQGVKTVNMTAGDKFGVMLIPKGRVSDVVDNPSIGGAQRPLFSLATANPDDEFHLGQIADVTGDGNTFVFEDKRFEISDYDHNDVIFQIRGAVGDAAYVGDVVDPNLDWRGDDMGQALIAYSDPYFTPTEQQDLTELAGLDGDEGDVGGDVPDDGGDSETDVDPDEAEVSDEADEVSEDDEAVTDESDDESDESDDESDESDDESDVAQTNQSDNSTTDSNTSDSSSTSSPETSSNESDSSLDDSTELTTDPSPESSVPVTDEVQDSEETDVDEVQDSEGTEAETTDEVEVSQEDLSGSDEEIEEEFSSSSPAAEPKPLETPTRFESAKEDQPLVGVIDTGFAENNPDLDYDNISLGKDLVDGDDNPLLAEGEGNEHGTHILGIIAAEQDNGEGIDGINPDAPIWLGRGVGSGEWADSLVEFVDAAKESGQPNAVVNLSMDLTQTDADGNVTTRYELTPMERSAIEYARQNGVLLVVAAGNNADVMSVLGQASQEFDNIITVGAAEQFDPETSVWKGAGRTEYSSYGRGLNVMAYGGTSENPELSVTGDGLGTMAGSSVATAKVTGAVSQVWAANPELSYRQVVEIIKDTATDLGETGRDLETGAGLVNMTAAVLLAKVTKPEEYEPEILLTPDTWGGEGLVFPRERAVGTEFMGKYYDWETYTLQYGDTLSSIARQTMGNSAAPYYNFIAQKNEIVNPAFLYTGQTISIPKEITTLDKLRNKPKELSLQIDSIAHQSIMNLYQQRRENLGEPSGKPIDLGNGFLKQNYTKGYITWNGKKAFAYKYGTQPEIYKDFDPISPQKISTLDSSLNKIYRRFNQSWQLVSGSAKDIAIGANGSVWVIGTDSSAGGYGIYGRYGQGWKRVPRGRGTEIAVDTDGNPWIINSENEIYKGYGLWPFYLNWKSIPGSAKDISIGADGSVWVVGTDRKPGGYGIYQWDTERQNWNQVRGGGTRITVAPNGKPWIVNSENEIYRWLGNSWERVSGYAKDIEIGADGSVWVVGTDRTSGGYGIYKWNGHGWNRTSRGGGFRIAVGKDGEPWVVQGRDSYLDELTSWSDWQWEDSINSAADLNYIKNHPSSDIGKLYRDLSNDLLGRYFPPSGAYISDDYNNAVPWMYSYHGAIDIGGYGIYNQPVKSLINGTVVMSTSNFGTLTILGNDGRYYIYKHLESRFFNQGQTVRKGDIVGRVGKRGKNGVNSFAPHLHLEVSQPPYAYGAAHYPSVLHSKHGIRERNYNPVKAYWELKNK